MKVYHVYESYPLFYQPYIPSVIKELQLLEGMDLKIIAFRGEKGKNNEAEVLPKYRKRKLISKIFQLINKKYRYLDFFEIKALKEKTDIVHIKHSFLYPKVINLLNIPQQNRPKIIITLRGGDTYVKPWLSDKWKSFYKNYGNKVDAFVVMSEDQKKYLSRWGVPLDNIHVIPISFGSKFEISPNVANADKLKLVSVFRMCWEKNIADNLRFVKALKDKNIPVEYNIYGDGPDLGQVYYLRDKLNLNDTVIIHGKVSNIELKSKLRTFDFVLQLSISESLGMSVIEAQSLGVPAIVSDSGGLPEIICDKQNGIVVDVDDFGKSIQEVISIWNNNLVYNEMSKSAIERSHQSYTVENEVIKLVELYGKLISL